MIRLGGRYLALLSLCAVTNLAHAGGLEFGANGTEALGRGGTFVAKADSPLAVEYNVAGLARLRGTRLLINGNLVLHNYEFQRDGVYPDGPTAGQPFPKVSQQGNPFFAPFIAVTTDFGYFDRWTFGISLFGPSAYGSRSYPLTVSQNGTDFPGSARYDLLKANLLLVYPTISAAVRVTKWMELGVNLQVVVGNFDLASVAYTAVPGCQSPDSTSEDPNCDTVLKVNLTGASATFALGALFHPVRGLDLGFHLRGPVYLNAAGTVNATAPPNAAMEISPEKATFSTRLPWVLRLGIRYAFKAPDNFEKGDIELDASYETWGEAEGTGDTIKIKQLSFFSNINATVFHHYKDTFSLRIGGAYNARMPKGKGVLAVRAGLMYDSAATNPNATRLDFDTMDKVMPTIGLGYRIRGISIDLAYAYSWEPDRHVTDGIIKGLDGASGAERANVVVNNGFYHANSQVLSIGLTVNWDEALRRRRILKYE